MSTLPPALWQISPVSDEPHTSLMNWRVFEVELNEGGPHSIHIVGYAWRYREGRVTSAIQTFDPQRLVAVSASGRIYELSGEPGYRRAAEYVWQEWLGATQARLVGEVTQDFVSGTRSLPTLNSRKSTPHVGASEHEG